MGCCVATAPTIASPVEGGLRGVHLVAGRMSGQLGPRQLTGLAYPRRDDTGGDRRPRPPSAGARPYRPRLRPASRCARHGPCCAHVALALLPEVPCRLWRDAVLLSHDPAHRAGDGPPAPGHVGHRRLRNCRVYVARVVQLPIHRDRRGDAVAVPGPRPQPPRARPTLRDHGGDATAANTGRPLTQLPSGPEQDRRSVRPAGAFMVVV